MAVFQQSYGAHEKKELISAKTSITVAKQLLMLRSRIRLPP